MTTRILWIGRHAPDSAQMDELESVFGEFEIVRYDKYVRRVKDVLKKAKECDVVVTILPTSFDIDFIRNDIFPVKSVRMNGAHVEFRMLTDVSVKSVSLKDYCGEMERKKQKLSEWQKEFEVGLLRGDRNDRT